MNEANFIEVFKFKKMKEKEY